MKIILVVFLLVGLSSASFGEEEEIKVLGTPSIAFNTDNTFINFGGPQIRFEKGETLWGLSFFPSLRHNSKLNEYSPILGAGPFVGFGRILLVAPTYFYSNNWYTAVGLGYKF